MVSRRAAAVARSDPLLHLGSALIPDEPACYDGHIVSHGDCEEAETLPVDPADGTPAPVPLAGRPLSPSWDRYELLELLGKGGMGVVYKARDRRLDRTVAIKLILGADPDLAMRFLREARAQARIDHANVCRVFEAGEVDGRAYIALQFVEGEALSRAAALMSLEDKVAVMRDVALAIQEAHRLGIVHRDIKPANIMVERGEDGRWVPIVMDFGLAREVTVEAGLTRSGVLLGTPAYMSPEQARGDMRAIDRRSDVYSLGATWYELVTGRAPFVGDGLASILSQVLLDEPPAPRSLAPSLPIDLETVALKCLAKDPAQRYPSARALADDLGRYLGGEPILGRRLPSWQRLRLRARRHRAAVAIAAWSLAALMVVAGLGVRAWLSSRSERAHAAERAALAEQLGRDAKDIELFLQLAYQLPLHDIRPEREIIRTRMHAIAATPHGLGALGDAIVHDALGRGHLALHEWREAADELARAVAAGRDTPELHAAFGRALGELYQQSLEDARYSGDRAWLGRRQRELEQEYLVPARAELARSHASGDAATLLEVLVAQYRRDFASAERLARAVVERAPWLVEARVLVAVAAQGAALDAFDRGDYNTARPAFERAAVRYAEATEAGRSDAVLLEATARTWLKRVELDARQGVATQDSIDKALDAIERALRADPESASAYTTKAYVLRLWYQTPALRGRGDQRPLLERVAQAATRAVELDPLDARAWDALGNAHVSRGTYEVRRGGDGAPWWNLALDEIGTALAIRPEDPWARNDAGVAHRLLGVTRKEAGIDPMPEYLAALSSYERAAALDPQYLYAWANQADLHALIAEYDHASGRDPRPAAERAVQTGDRCLAIDPNYYVTLDTLAEVQFVVADYLVDTGGDPSDALRRLRGYVDRADVVHPEHVLTWRYRLIAARVEAEHRLRDGADPTRSIAEARDAARRTLGLAPGFADEYFESARVDLVEAGWLERAKRDATGALDRARANAEKAIALDEQSSDAALVAAEVYLQLAIVRRSPAVVERGLGYADRALMHNPWLVRAQAIRAQLLRLRAPG
jgi:serine/threonine-protein kinase